MEKNLIKLIQDYEREIARLNNELHLAREDFRIEHDLRKLREEMMNFYKTMIEETNDSLKSIASSFETLANNGINSSIVQKEDLSFDPDKPLRKLRQHECQEPQESIDPRFEL